MLRWTALGLARWVRAGSSSSRISSVTHWLASVRVSGGKTRVAGGGSPSGPEGAGERQPVRVSTGICCDAVHQPPDRVVDAEVSVDFLKDPVGQLGAQHNAGATLMGLELAERALNLPALEVQFGQFPRRSCFWIRDRGEESVGQGLGLRRYVGIGAGDGGDEAVLDHPHRDAVGVVAPGLRAWVDV